ERGLGVRNDGPKARHAPARADERRRRGMLPALELGYAERDDVRLEKSATPFQRREQPAVHLREGRLQRFGVRAPGERERFPSHLLQMQLVPDCFQRGGALRGQEPLEPRRKSAQLSNRFHTGNVESAWILRYPIRRLNLGRSCAGLLSSRRFSRS